MILRFRWSSWSPLKNKEISQSFTLFKWFKDTWMMEEMLYQIVHNFLKTNWTTEAYIGCPYPCPWVLGGHGWDMGGHGWAWVHACIQLQIRVKLLGCREYANQEALRCEASDNERPFICPIQPRLGVVGNTHYTNLKIYGHNLNSMGRHGWAHVML
jgi:hypothetical protein